MNGQPYCILIRIRPLNTVLKVGRNIDVITGPHNDGFFSSFNHQPGFAFD